MAKTKPRKTSRKQIAANRSNALKSTGPRTTGGKTAVRYNALTHGLLAQKTLLPDEDETTLEDLGNALRVRLQPDGEVEDILVDRIVSAAWRLRRVLAIEAGVLEHERKDAKKYSHVFEGQEDEDTPETLGLAWIHCVANTDVVSPLSRYETTVERGFYRALHELERIQTRRAGGVVPPPEAVDISVSKGE